MVQGEESQEEHTNLAELTFGVWCTETQLEAVWQSSRKGEAAANELQKSA